MKKNLPWIITGIFALWLIGSFRQPKDRDFAATDFGLLPAVFNGRVQPLDSIARNTLLQLREKQSANLEPWKSFNEKPKIISADEWLMDVTMRPEKADDYPVFRIDHPELVSLLKLPLKDDEKKQDGKHYSWNQIRENFQPLQTEVERIDTEKKEASQRTPFEQGVIKLYSGLNLYMQLKNMVQPQDAQDFAAELANLENAPPEIKAQYRTVIRSIRAGMGHEKDFDREIIRPIGRYAAMAGMKAPFLLPPASESHKSEDWSRIGDAMIDYLAGDPLPPALTYYARMSSAYRQGKVDEFNQAVQQYRASLATGMQKELAKARREQAFNFFAPFYKSLVIYVMAFLLACGFWFNLAEWMRRSAVWLIVLAFVVHTGGLITRMVLEGRPPVTNLYSSAIFIGWGAVVLGVILERFYKDGIGAVVASSVGFLTLIIAHNLALSGDTMEMMQAVLDTNFWLATHVVVVTLGYASTFVAGFLALIYVLRGVFTTTLSAQTGKALARMVYGIICFATLFSFVGTVLGGIWADQSWGRFWGWDPKENGALIIVIWNALILHARWGGMVKERGIMNMAVIGNIVTSWSWFGVNMLGIGLHSYGFMSSAFRWLMLFVISQVGVFTLGMLPDRFWASCGGRQPKTAPPSKPSPEAPMGGKEKPLPTA